MRKWWMLMLVVAVFFSFAPVGFAESEIDGEKEGKEIPLPEVIDNLVPTTVQFNKEQYSPGEKIEFTAETDKIGTYVPGSIQAFVAFEKVKLKYLLTSSKKLYTVKGSIIAPEEEGTYYFHYTISMKDKSGKEWVGYYYKRLTIASTKTLTLSPSKATVKVGEEVLLIGKHVKGLKAAETTWNSDGDTGYYTFTKNVVRLPDEEGYHKEVASFVAGQPGDYIIYFSLDYKEKDGTLVEKYLSAKITVERP